MIPIVCCTRGSKALNVMKCSIENYSPETKLIVYESKHNSFGESYNSALTQAYQDYDEVIVANDDIVINPSTMPLLLGDIHNLKENYTGKIGFVTAMADNVRVSHNIRIPFFGNEDKIINYRWTSETVIKTTEVVAPIFAYLSKEAFQEAQFPPTDWYSDDLICWDLEKKGYKHFISRSYVHHVGGSTVGTDYTNLNEKAKAWLREHRPEFLPVIDQRRISVLK